MPLNHETITSALAELKALRKLFDARAGKAVPGIFSSLFQAPEVTEEKRAAAEKAKTESRRIKDIETLVQDVELGEAVDRLNTLRHRYDGEAHNAATRAVDKIMKAMF